MDGLPGSLEVGSAWLTHTSNPLYFGGDVCLHKYPAVQEGDALTRLSLGSHQVTNLPVT